MGRAGPDGRAGVRLEQFRSTGQNRQSGKPVNAIPAAGAGDLSVRYVVGADPAEIIPAIEAQLAAHGFGRVAVSPARLGVSEATRSTRITRVRFAAASLAETTEKKPAILPNLGHPAQPCVRRDLELPTFVPHSYAACSQHAPNEHLLPAVAREGLQIMAGLFWDIGAGGTPATA